MEREPVRAEFRQPLNDMHDIQRRPGRTAERIGSSLTDRPKAE